MRSKHLNIMLVHFCISYICTNYYCGKLWHVCIFRATFRMKSETEFDETFYLIFVIARTVINYHCPERPIKLKYWNTTVNIVSTINNIQGKYKVLIMSCHRSSSRKKQRPFSINNWRNLPYANFMGIWQRVMQTQYPTY